MVILPSHRPWAAALLLAGVACGGGGATTKPAVVPTDKADPVERDPVVAGPTGAQQIMCGDYHTCARMGDGSVRCWGRNSEGELGDGTKEMRNKPTIVPGVTGVKALALGDHETCALMADRNGCPCVPYVSGLKIAVWFGPWIYPFTVFIAIQPFCTLEFLCK